MPPKRRKRKHSNSSQDIQNVTQLQPEKKKSKKEVPQPTSSEKPHDPVLMVLSTAELLASVFSFVEDKYLLLSTFRLVNKLWNQVTLLPSLWLVVNLSSSPNKEDEERNKEVSKMIKWRGHLIADLQVCGFGAVDMIAENCTNLTGLQLCRSCCDDPSSLELLVSNNPALEKFYSLESAFTDDEEVMEMLILEKCQNIKEFYIEGVDDSDITLEFYEKEAEILQEASKRHKFERLEIHNPMELSAEVMAVVAANSPNLRRVCVSFATVGECPGGMYDGDKFLQALAEHAKQLQYFQLSNVDVTCDGVSVLVEARKGTLVGVAIERLGHFTDKKRTENFAPVLHKLLFECPALEFLTFDYSLLNDQTLLQLCHCFDPKLAADKGDAGDTGDTSNTNNSNNKIKKLDLLMEGRAVLPEASGKVKFDCCSSRSSSAKKPLEMLDSFLKYAAEV
eukprot:CAMPEP_0174251696 /NCGR_PEP_ID=MMETSP0439-20130205/1440_1 /TAXON_ID=0 /ORGANISM="Stereomyxa ramosa, Strain Chinc5" /LENGTH=449 /DNA_ID=CAMNT_0015332085 /DNA_START=22 /DNA_END=1368 /DNA_ORIENTATION=+